jgi:hypothetical protein
MKKVIVATIGLVALGACSATSETATTAAATSTVVAAAATEQRSAFVGSWTGRIDTGEEVRVVVPASGTPTYYFAGYRQLVQSHRFENGKLAMRIGPRGAATVDITPIAGGKLNLKYRLGNIRADIDLSRS